MDIVIGMQVVDYYSNPAVYINISERLKYIELAQKSLLDPQSDVRQSIPKEKCTNTQ